MRIIIEISDELTGPTSVPSTRVMLAGLTNEARAYDGGGAVVGTVTGSEIAAAPSVAASHHIEVHDAGPAPGSDLRAVKVVTEAGFGGEPQALHADTEAAPYKGGTRKRSRQARSRGLGQR
jgi:hypothetical protein